MTKRCLTEKWSDEMPLDLFVTHLFVNSDLLFALPLRRAKRVGSLLPQTVNAAAGFTRAGR
jgi:hypothetical protein